MFGQARANRQNFRAQQERQRQIDAGAQQNATQINSQLGGLAGILSAFAQTPLNSERATATAFQFDPITGQQVTAPTFGAAQAGLASPISADMINTEDVFSGGGSRGFNVGQDALMQFLRADPEGRMTGANGTLQEIAQTGLPSNLSSMFADATAVNQANNADILASITGQSRSVGQRFGSATRRIEGETARRLANEQALQNSQFALQAGEAAANRRLSAASQLGSFQLQGAGQLLNAGQNERALLASLLQGNQQANLAANQFNAGQANANAQFNASSQNQVSAQNAANLLQSLLSNQQANNQLAQFNVTAGMQANQQNNAAAMQAIFGNNQQMLNERQLAQSAAGQAGSISGQQGALLNQLLGIRAGAPVPQMQGNTATAIGSGMQDLATLFAAYNRFGGNRAPGMPATQYIAPIDLGPMNVNTNRMVPFNIAQTAGSTFNLIR